jgi:hypothetical protein
MQASCQGVAAEGFDLTCKLKVSHVGTETAKMIGLVYLMTGSLSVQLGKLMSDRLISVQDSSNG